MTTMRTQDQGVIVALLGTVLALIGTLTGVRLTPEQQNAIYVAGALLVAVVLAVFHVAASAAVTEGLPAVDFHSTGFWAGVVATAATLATVVFGAHLTPTQVHLLVTAAGLVAALVLGTAHVGAAGMTATLQRRQQAQKPPASPAQPPQE